MDVMRGQVVRGVGGRRDEYRPIQSALVSDPQPATVARAFLALGFREIYLADLDAIQQKQQKRDRSNFQKNDSRPLYFELMRLGVALWVDAGLRNPDDARALANFHVDGRPLAGIVAGLESLAGPRELAEMCAAVAPERLIFSLDLKHGAPLTSSPDWHGLAPLEIAAVALRAGVRRMIVLDLAQVGTGAGVGTEPLCRTLRCLAPGLEIVAGGGVRGPADLDSLARAGCDAALVASALHDGRLTPENCAALASATGVT
jgi:phosphoribosylformimino-5-aminoimidazole carboxamide ribotide isomerase